MADDAVLFSEFLFQNGKGGVAHTNTTKIQSYNSIPLAKRNLQNRLYATSEKKQVVVKVIGRGQRGSNHSSLRKGLFSIKRLTNYLSKDEVNNFESRDGIVLSNIDDVNKFIEDEWLHDFTNRKNGNDFLHIVVSTPVGSGRRDTELAAKMFGKEFFNNNDYLTVRHDDTNNPHVHFIVKVKGDNGKRLNLRKKDLQLARETFAYYSRANHIDVAASYRTWRGQQKSFIEKNNGIYTPVSSSNYFNKPGVIIDNIKRSKIKEASEFRKIAVDVSKKSGSERIVKALLKHSNKILSSIEKDKER